MFTVGFRYDHETNSLGIDQTARFAGAYPDPRAFGSTGSPLYRAVVAINQGVAGIVAQASGSAAATDRTFDAFLPKAGIQMAWTPNLKRSEEHTSELQSLMRISYAVFCLKKK